MRFRPRPGFAPTIRTAPPIRDLRLVDLVSLAILGRQTWGRADRTVDVDDAAADAADQMMVVVADPILETRRGSCRLNAPDEAFADQQGEGVIHRLQGNCADFGSDGLGDAVGRDVRLMRHRSQHGQPLRGDLDTAVTKGLCRIAGQRR